MFPTSSTQRSGNHDVLQIGADLNRSVELNGQPSTWRAESPAAFSLPNSLRRRAQAREKCAVAAVPGLDQHDAGVGGQFGVGLGGHADKGIVESVKDQGGHGNVLGAVGTGNAVVVVVRTGKAAVSRDKLLVKLPPAVYRPE